MADNIWSELPIDVLEEVVKQLPREVDEFIRFSAVCKHWRSSLFNSINQQLNTLPCAPWLMLVEKENELKTNDHDEEGIRSFYIVSGNNRVVNIELPTQGRRCWGTPYGWLFTLGLDLKINLFNPLSRLQISLPSQPTFVPQFTSCNWPRRICRTFIKKIALTSNPKSTSSSTLVMAIYGEFCYLASASPGDEVWRRIGALTGVEDVVFYNGYFYVVCFGGIVSVIDIDNTPPRTTLIASPPDGVTLSNIFYLIELFGELHFVERVSISKFANDSDDDDDECEIEYVTDSDVDCDQGSKGNQFSDYEEEEYETDTSGIHSHTKGFHVFKLNSTKEWDKVDDLGEYALFLGNNTSFAISTFDYPQFKGNCIYFTDDKHEQYLNGYCDMGVYDLCNGTVSTIYPANDELSTFSRPVFFMPTSF